MIFRNYNDFEIISMIKQDNEEAFMFMVEKYKFFIAKNIKKFNLIKQYDDIFQESLMILYKSAIRFDESYNKSFMRYFENNLINRLISLKKKDNKHGEFLATKLKDFQEMVICEPMNVIYSECEIKGALNEFSELEKEVFQTKIIGKLSVRETSKKLQYSEKQIYNALDRIKKKIKLHLM